MADSVRETLMKEVVRRLQQIQTDNGYSVDIAKVERQKHAWDGDRHVANELKFKPAILILTDFETMRPDEAGYFLRDLGLELHYYTDSTTADDEVVVAAIADMQKALFTDVNGQPDDRFGVNARTELEARTFNRELNQPEDGVVLSLSIQYRTQINDPTKGL